MSIIAGLESKTSGEIYIAGKIGYLLQKDNLLEWRTIYNNVLLGLEIQKNITAENKEYVDLVTKDDIPNIKKVIHNLYEYPLKDHDYIQSKIYQFSTYVEMKNLNDSFDLDDFNQIEAHLNNIKNIEEEIQQLKGKKPCPNCGKTIDAESKFCNYCGTVLE